MRWLLCAVLLAGSVQAAEEPATEKPPAEETKARPPEKKLFHGQVLLLGEALKKRGVPAYPEMDKLAVLETLDGDLIPILSDWRGRAFFQDDRLRNRKVELIGQRQQGLPWLQVLVVYTFDDKGERQYTDYWCDICSIPMYEIKPCECCQGDIRLRFQPQELPDYLNQKPE